MSTDQSRRKVYRLRNLPAHVDRLSATELIASAINDDHVTPSDIEVFSLALTASSESWKKDSQTKEATLSFKQTPAVVERAQDGAKAKSTEWRFAVPALAQPLVLDTHFLGFTVLNSVAPSDHTHDCIAISGLASHPFGSWQPKGDDKSFMWIRDALPSAFPGIRFLTYGYDTTLKDSRSFQNVVDLAKTLMLAMEANGWASLGTKPFLFLAHSLGGILLKQMLIMLADDNNRAAFMLSIIEGAVFFGTPSAGMPIPQLLAMVGDQSNKDFVECLSDQSKFLENLETQFQGISFIQKKRLFWAYETQTSPTVVRREDGSYDRSGPETVMVDPPSATGDRYTSDPTSTIQIDENHSNMVKFQLNDHRIPVVIQKIRHICRHDENAQSFIGIDPMQRMGLIEERLEQVDNDFGYDSPTASSFHDLESSSWDCDWILQFSIQSPERDSRLEQIEQKFGHTFDWAYEDPSVGLSQWLRKGTDIFWVSGKPGSGKSTFMKFLFQDPRTAQLLHNWRSTSSQITVSFFFHHRGTLQQKSFDGLVRSLLSQLLEREPRLQPILDEMLDDRLQARLKLVEHMTTLRSDIQRLLRRCGISPHNATPYEMQLESLLSRDPVSRLNSLFAEIFPAIEKREALAMKYAILSVFSRLAIATVDKELQDREVKNTWPHVIRCMAKDRDRMPEADYNILMERWCRDCLDLDGLIRGFLERHDLQKRSHGKIRSGKSARERDRKLDEYIHELTKRQRSRQILRLDVQFTKWSIFDVEEGLRKVLDQELLDLEVCLFFDALDEYDGRPEVVSEFLKDLVNKSPSSKTKAKILFSSRPWPVFRDEFSHCPGFKIHEYTQEDIEDYCIGLLSNDSMAKELIMPMALDITRRARGVFLWVRLAMRDLIMEVSKHGGTTDPADMVVRLQQCLDSIPDELHDYYSSIIQRLPLDIRKETYILLECLSRATVELTLSQVPLLIRYGLAQSFIDFEARKLYMSRTERTMLDIHLRTISGGLADVVDDERLERLETRRLRSIATKYAPAKIDGDARVQLLHQTCKDWVESSTFKYMVLQDRANMTWENGHSFLVKFHIQKIMADRYKEERSTVSMIFTHAKQAEETTGVSQFAYLSRIPKTFYTKMKFRGPNGIPANSFGLATAARYGLWLYLKEAMRHDKYVFENTIEPLFSGLMAGERGDPTIAKQHWVDLTFDKSTTLALDVVEMGHFLLQNGFRVENDREGVRSLLLRMWKSPDREAAQQYIDLVVSAVEKSLLHVETRLSGWGYPYDDDLDSRLLHYSPPALVTYLLDRGAQVNSLEVNGATPLDYLLQPSSLHRKDEFGMDWLHQIACLLIQRGGKLNRARSYAFLEEVIDELSERGFDTGPLELLRPPAAPKLQHQQEASETRNIAELQPRPGTGGTAAPGNAATIHLGAGASQSSRKRDLIREFFRNFSG
ncbi:hypothetical protein B0T19DRAFT_296559 [Cercophora scortea]|uniref:Nephrocystin 3-like N-terminal domain-containing protein n=1 Tax=Cercophora scortea TaxID=314031 RepID=A0AAE0I3Y1_9PEZI|nr:hypothetical protein B0T19DRAFT_296559 [Cercophora scortea]